MPPLPSLSARDGERAPPSLERRERPPHDQLGQDRGFGYGSPDFGGGVHFDEETCERGHIPGHERSQHRTPQTPRIPQEDNVPKGCSLHSMEPLREWFCKGADMTSPAEYEAALCQLEENPPDIRQFNVNLREEQWTHFSLEGVKFPAATVDVIQRGEALAIFERDLPLHFQQISRAAPLYIHALLGWVKRALEIYRRVDETKEPSMVDSYGRRIVACTCGRFVDGSIDRGMEEC